MLFFLISVLSRVLFSSLFLVPGSFFVVSAANISYIYLGYVCLLITAGFIADDSE